MGCLIPEENKSEVELTDNWSDVVNSTSSLPTAKPKASSRCKAAFGRYLFSVSLGGKNHQSSCSPEGKIANSQSDRVFTSEPSVQFPPLISSSLHSHSTIPQLYFSPFNSSHFVFSHQWQNRMKNLSSYLSLGMTPKIHLLKNWEAIAFVRRRGAADGTSGSHCHWVLWRTLQESEGEYLVLLASQMTAILWVPPFPSRHLWHFSQCSDQPNISMTGTTCSIIAKRNNPLGADAVSALHFWMVGAIQAACLGGGLLRAYWNILQRGTSYPRLYHLYGSESPWNVGPRMLGQHCTVLNCVFLWKV